MDLGTVSRTAGFDEGDDEDGDDGVSVGVTFVRFGCERRRSRSSSSSSSSSSSRRRREKSAVARAVVALVVVTARGIRAFELDVNATQTSPTSVTYSGAAGYFSTTVDACGTCGGDGTACQGCDGVANSGTVFDACGACGTSCDKTAAPGACAFNTTCEDCGGGELGGRTVDACGACKTPTDSTFSRAGVPDYHLGGCVGCDGVANSGMELDVCGVCGGKGCDGDDPSLWSWCCDCAGVAGGSSVIDLCCDCVDAATFYPSGSKPATHLQIEALWEQGRMAYAAATDALATFDSTSKKRVAADDHFATAEQAFTDAWTLVTQEKNADQTGAMCFPTLSANAQAANTRDACGVCQGDTSTCIGCSVGSVAVPIGPFGGLHEDDCNLCDGQNSYDVCGVCVGGDTSQGCFGCDGIEASGKVFDACHQSNDERMYDNYGTSSQILKYTLGEVGSGCSDPTAFEQACANGEGGCCGCDGVPNSGKTLDACGTCLANDDAARVVDATECTSIFLIKLASGVIIGPYTKDEVKSGSVTYTDPTTSTLTQLSIEPETLIANAAIVQVDEPILYGNTSKEEEHLTSWQSIYVDGRDDVLNSTNEVGVDNVVYVRGQLVKTTSEYEQLSTKDGFVGVAYPSCTAATYRNAHRLHGKKTGTNYLGIVTSSELMPEDWTAAAGLQNRDWNRQRERILDYVTGWADQACTCKSEWLNVPEPIPPTCERVWIQADEQTKQAQMSRSWADGSWRVTGGWWAQDFGQKTTADQEKRGPRRIDSFGTLRTQITKNATGENNAYGECEFKSLQVIDAVQNATGAIWHTTAQDVASAFNVSFKFMVTKPSIACDSVQSVSGAFAQSLHTKLYDKCTTSGGDGFAFVIRDDTPNAPTSDSIGKGGPSLGYGGIGNSIAVEFDTVYTADYTEPRESHVAIHTRGRAPNTAHSSASLATVALDGSISTSSINDGQVHEVLITYTPNITVDDMFYYIDSGQITGLSTALSSHSADSLGIFSVYVDDLTLPIMSVPFNMESIMRNISDSTTAWVGFTASSGYLWQAVHILEWNMTFPP